MSQEKPLIFISHSSKDKDVAWELKRQIIEILDIESRDVFVSSAPDDIRITEDWFDVVEAKLQEADAMIVLISEQSMGSNWVWFEIGHYWAGGAKNIYPLALSGSEIPHPLNTKQAKHLDNAEEINAFFSVLCEQFDGNINEIDSAKLVTLAQLQHYPTYSETDIQEKLRDFLNEQPKPTEWIIYAELDQKQGFVTGTSKQWLKLVADELGLMPEKEEENGIRFIKPRRRLQATTVRWA